MSMKGAGGKECRSAVQCDTKNDIMCPHGCALNRIYTDATRFVVLQDVLWLLETSWLPKEVTFLG